MIAVMNEKYANDASIFTCRDRRGNAAAGYWNRGPVPFGYESRVVVTDGRKGRKKLFILEQEAAVVRLIYELATLGLTGRPMGTRAIAKHLNANGYTLRGKPFFHSNVDGILTREHYVGAYRDRTVDAKGVKPTEEEAIVVSCPQIIAADIIARVFAIRAKGAPGVTPPRFTNSPWRHRDLRPSRVRLWNGAPDRQGGRLQILRLQPEGDGRCCKLPEQGDP